MRITALLIFVAVCACVWAQSTTRRHLRVAPVAAAAAAAPVVAPTADTVASPPDHAVDISGYDKPLRSRRESMFVSNNGSAELGGIAFTLVYSDAAGRQIHSTRQHLPTAIPPGQTRQLSFKSWDLQMSFYYIHSAVPARSPRAMPYDVAISVDTLFFVR